MTRRTFTAIFIIGILLRIFWINVPPLWYDENFTLILARLPFDQMLKATAGDVHPPLWYLIEWTAYHIAPNLSAWKIRIPAFTFSSLSLVAFYCVMRQLNIPARVQTAAFALMAVMPFQLWYAQEGRMYAMLEFFVLFTLAAALDRNYIALFIGSLCLLYTQNYGPFYIAAIFLAGVAFDLQDVKAWITSAVDQGGWTLQGARKLMIPHMLITQRASIAVMVGASVLWLPWYRVVSQQMTDITGRYWIMDKSLGSVLTILYKLFLTAAVPSEFFFASYVVTFAALILGVIAFIRSTHPARLTVAIMAFTPLLIAWLASLVWQPVLLFRPLIGVSPFLYLVVCWTMYPEG